MTWAAISSPTRPAASAPASTAALTLPTSPRTIVVTKAPPIWIVFTTSTLAALHIASVASTRPTQPLVSIRPSAFPNEPFPFPSGIVLSLVRGPSSVVRCNRQRTTDNGQTRLLPPARHNPAIRRRRRRLLRLRHHPAQLIVRARNHV